jgi:CheY-like chemotaxis protein
MRHRNPIILVADDDADDRLLVERAFKSVCPSSRLQMVKDGEEAIKHMMGEGPYADREKHPYPNFIITDLKMPRKDGLSVLEFLKKNSEWAIIPTVVWSGSNNDDDIKKSYMLGASSYVVKPSGRDELMELIQALCRFWMLCETPETDSTGRRLRTRSEGRIGDRYPQDGDEGESSRISQ